MFNPKVKNEQTDLLIKAVLSLSNTEDAYRFFEDLCTAQEFKSLAQRIAVAELLGNKTTYQEIVEKTGASSATVSRVNRSYQYGADGYQRILT
ncbi:MAG: TrpR-like protein YerC/YecD, partial [Clostridiales bacterium]|nr:TrpR-like protein YerC/YecD [Clostridiales bacterium]